MKRHLLILLVVLLIPISINAKIEKKVDTFDNNNYYYHTIYLKLKIDWGFNINFTINFPQNIKKITISARCLNLYSGFTWKNSYIEPEIKIKIDNNIYTLITESNNIVISKAPETTFDITDDVYNAIIATKDIIIIRFSYKHPDGQSNYYDLQLPIKYVNEIQQMYMEHKDQ